MKIMEELAKFRAEVSQLILSKKAEHFVIAVIIFNGLILGLDASSFVSSQAKIYLDILDLLCLYIFTLEIILVIFALGFKKFFSDPWRIFDFLVIFISLIPPNSSLSILRTLRVLRVLRLLTKSWKMRSIINALLGAIPGIISIIFLLFIIFFVSGIIVTNMFGKEFPDYFSSLGISILTLFQIMTLDGWSSGILRTLLYSHPYAWMFFVPFVVITSFAILNLFVAILVEAMQSKALASNRKKLKKIKSLEIKENKQIHSEIKDLKAQIEEMKELLNQLAKK